ncbi:MAG: helicase-associated domain-containing protein, partial [Chloroflexi bacterium]|nr:helicase-associated domain-containing protein [Chloroflexota bacterium]
PVRYQLARFCEWDEEKPDENHYHLTPRSLAKAKEQGLKVEHLLALLAKHADAGIPPVLVKSLKRWEVNGTEARAETQVVLKVSSPNVLEELRKSKASRFLGEPLGPTSIVIKAGAQSKVMAALAELGLLAEDNTDTSLRANEESEAISSQRRSKS